MLPIPPFWSLEGMDNIKACFVLLRDFPDSSVTENLPANAGDVSLIPGSGRSPEEGNGYPLPYSCLENSKDRGSWQAIVHGVTKSQTQLSDLHFHFFPFYSKFRI